MQANQFLSIAILSLAFVAVGCDEVGEDENDDTESTKPPPPEQLEESVLDSAQPLDLIVGEPWEAHTDASTSELQPRGYWEQGMSWSPLKAGQSAYVNVSLTATESLAIHAIPSNTSGDIDIHLYRNGSYIKSSTRGAGYIDQVFTPPYTAGWSGSYTIAFSCYSGICNFGTNVVKGDDTKFTTYSPYLNQRSFTTNTQSCYLNGWKPDGECMCAPSSAAMALVAGGKRKISELASAAQDLFDHCNNSEGAALRYELMNRLKTNYAYSTCEEIANSSELMANIRNRLRYNYMVLFRSTSLTSAGHYIQVRGYEVVNGQIKLRVNDPMGVWSGKDTWSPKNTTTTGYGGNILVDYETIRKSNASVIACK